MAFDGDITGVGTQSGHRLVIGRWRASPFGAFADVMHEAPDGHRRLLAPTQPVADFVAATYRFDLIEVTPVAAERDGERLRIVAADLIIEIDVGSRTGLGRLLRVVPGAVARSRWWCTAIDPVAVLVMHGVRTRGTAGGGRTEWYGATDQHRIAALRGTLGGQDLGALADVDPPVRFGFSSAPITPSVVDVRTTIAIPATVNRRKAGGPPPTQHFCGCGPPPRISRAGRRARGGCHPGRGS